MCRSENKWLQTLKDYEYSKCVSVEHISNFNHIFQQIILSILTYFSKTRAILNIMFNQNQFNSEVKIREREVI